MRHADLGIRAWSDGADDIRKADIHIDIKENVIIRIGVHAVENSSD